MFNIILMSSLYLKHTKYPQLFEIIHNVQSVPIPKHTVRSHKTKCIYTRACAPDNVQAETELPLSTQEYTATILFQKNWMNAPWS